MCSLRVARHRSSTRGTNGGTRSLFTSFLSFIGSLVFSTRAMTHTPSPFETHQLDSQLTQSLIFLVSLKCPLNIQMCWLRDSTTTVDRKTDEDEGTNIWMRLVVLLIRSSISWLWVQMLILVRWTRASNRLTYPIFSISWALS